MDLSSNTKIHLSKFKPRDYQKPLFDAIENKGIKKAVLVWHRRCVASGTHVLMANGSYRKIENLKKGDSILSWNGSAFEPDTIVDIWNTGVKKAFQVSSNGSTIVTSSDHQFAHSASTGECIRWDALENIKPNRSLMHYAGTHSINEVDNDLRAEFWGYMLSDGYVSGYQQPKFTNTNLDILKRVEFLADHLFGIKAIWRRKGNGFDLGLSNGSKGGGSIPNSIKKMFRDNECDVVKSKQPMPEELYSYSKQSLIYFFAAAISADGCISVNTKTWRPSGTNKVVPHNVEIVFNCGASDDYAWGMYWLLRKVGIITQSPYKERGSNWKIKVGKCQYTALLLSVTIHGKQEKQEEALDVISSFKKRPRNLVKGCYRATYKKTDHETALMYDLTTLRNHNFIANGFIVHNCGKDVACFNLILRQAIKTVGHYYYILPTYRQAKLVVWAGMLMDGQKFLDFIPPALISSIHQQEMKITLVNNSQIYFLGSDNVDSLRGSNPKGIVFSEYAYQHPETYPTLRPILVANDGWCVFISTPFGENHFYKLYEVAKESPEWFCDIKTIEDTGVVSLDQIDKEEQEGLMSRDMIEQEYYCSFSVGAVGSYYGRYLNTMEMEGKIGSVEWEPSHLVHTAWDLGVRDATVILFFQVIGKSIHILDSYSNDSVGLEHYVSVATEKPYRYGKHFAPHDIMVKEFGSGMTRLDKAKQLGITFETRTDHRNVRTSAVPNVSIMDGIETVRSTLPKIWIDKGRCKKLVSALRDYRREYDSKNKVYKSHPCHDYNSHWADCLRYLCLSLSRLRVGTTPEELDRRYREAMSGDQELPAFFR